MKSLLLSLLLIISSLFCGQDLYVGPPLKSHSIQMQSAYDGSSVAAIARYGITDKVELACRQTFLLSPVTSGISAGIKIGVLDSLDVDVDFTMLDASVQSQALGLGIEYRLPITTTFGINAAVTSGDLFNFQVGNIGILIEPILIVTSWLAVYLDLAISGLSATTSFTIFPNVDLIITEKFGVNIGGGYETSSKSTSYLLSFWLDV